MACCILCLCRCCLAFLGMVASERAGWCLVLSAERACVKSNWWFILLSLGRPQGTYPRPPPPVWFGTVFVGPLLLDDLGMRRKRGGCVRPQGYRTVLLAISAFLSSSRCTYFCYIFFGMDRRLGGRVEHGGGRVWGRTGVWYPAGWYTACHRMVLWEVSSWAGVIWFNQFAVPPIPPWFCLRGGGGASRLGSESV